MFSKRSHKKNAELTERFSISENIRLIQDLPGVHRLAKLTVNEGFLAVIVIPSQNIKDESLILPHINLRSGWLR